SVRVRQPQLDHIFTLIGIIPLYIDAVFLLTKERFYSPVAFMCIRASEHLLILAVALLYLFITNATQALYGALTSNKCITLLLATSLAITTLYCALEGDFPS
ncbi:hypothetical protein, partial [Vibrio campbellii]|uniref:hypothetical protein n=1 Tax=Vibrio campbellii TaxID=680 RepID=UPI001BDB3DD7